MRKNPQSPTYHDHLGLVYQKRNDLGKVRQHLERAVQINPKHPSADEARKALEALQRG
ncbi:MAG: tetratricopeptide repeat protein [Acidobacteriia bacterium]|nr:tetratricopeptide repeat protein [Terriglobia bacterium]